MRTITETKNIELYLPKINVKKRLKKVQITGVSRMLDPEAFYTDLINKLEDLYFQFNRTLIVDFNFEYINSGSTKWLLHVVQQLEFLSRSKGLIEVNWLYEQDDETIEMFGDVLKSRISLPVNLITIN